MVDTPAAAPAATDDQEPSAAPQSEAEASAFAAAAEKPIDAVETDRPAAAAGAAGGSMFGGLFGGGGGSEPKRRVRLEDDVKADGTADEVPLGANEVPLSKTKLPRTTRIQHALPAGNERAMSHLPSGLEGSVFSEGRGTRSMISVASESEMRAAKLALSRQELARKKDNALKRQKQAADTKSKLEDRRKYANYELGLREMQQASIEAARQPGGTTEQPGVDAPLATPTSMRPKSSARSTRSTARPRANRTMLDSQCAFRVLSARLNHCIVCAAGSHRALDHLARPIVQARRYVEPAVHGAVAGEPAAAVH